MGTFGSKEDLGQLVAIYGYHCNVFPWKDSTNRKVYHTTGLIVGHAGGRKYVITTRSSIVCCKNIVMYHSYFRNTEPVMRNDLEILFQSIEQNIIILGTKKCYELDLNQSEIIRGEYDAKNICPFHNLCENNSKYLIPTKRSQYYTFIMDMDLNSDTIKYCAHIYDVKYLESFVHDKTYLPENYMYKYILKNDDAKSEAAIKSPKLDLHGINGSVIFNKKRGLIGMITKTVNDFFFVLPKKTLVKIFNGFIDNLDHPLDYQGLLSLPIQYTITNNFALIVSDSTIDTTSGPVTLKANDKIVSLDENNIIINNAVNNTINNTINALDTDQDEAMIFDKDYGGNIPLSFYLKYNLDKKTPIKLGIIRRKKLMHFMVCGSICPSNDLPLTNQPFFFPDNFIPYVKLGPLIIVQLTHELLDIAACHAIFIKNNVLDDYLDGLRDDMKNVLIIIDCFDNVLSKKYSLPQLKIIDNSKQILNCPVVTAINNNVVVTNLSNLRDIINKIGKNIDHDHEIILTAGFSYQDQYQISV